MNYDYLPSDLVQLFATSYVGSGPVSARDCSPTFSSNLRILPPLLIEFGYNEVLYDQIMAFIAKCIAADVNVEFNLHDDMVHVFQLFCFTQQSQCTKSFENIKVRIDSEDLKVLILFKYR